MKKLFTGLCMAWGNFCYIPGIKKWDEEARSMMLGWLPFIGFVIGALWMLIYFGLAAISLPVFFIAAILVWLPFVLSGFIHVDGFMDVSDATLSRGEVVKRRRILKDSNVGMFAVVSFFFLVLIEFAAITSAMSYNFDPFNLVIIPIFSRAIAALEVLNFEPMPTSQYSGKPSAKAGNIMVVIQMILGLGLAAPLARYYLGTGIVILATILGTLISCLIAKRNLGGMNGDIAGYSIVWGELFGILVLLVC